MKRVPPEVARTARGTLINTGRAGHTRASASYHPSGGDGRIQPSRARCKGMSERSRQYQLLTWLLTQSSRCHYCQRPVERYTDILQGFDVNPVDGVSDLTAFQRSYLFQYMATVDHVIPRSEGGKTSRDNVVLACWCCNQARHRKKGKRRNAG